MEDRDLSPLLLAYLGDAALEVMVRERLVMLCPDNASCHAAALEYVTASKQAEAARRLRDLLTPEEKAVFIGARNAKAHSAPQHADPYEYRLATGFEALFGWLYRRGEHDRMEELFRSAYPDPVRLN